MNENKDWFVGRTLTFFCACAGSEGHHLWAAEDRLRRGVWAQQQRQHGETQVHVHPRLQEAGLYCEFSKFFFLPYQMSAERGHPHAATGLPFCLRFSAGHLSEPSKIILTGMDFAFSEAWTISWLFFPPFFFLRTVSELSGHFDIQRVNRWRGLHGSTAGAQTLWNERRECADLLL